MHELAVRLARFRDNRQLRPLFSWIRASSISYVIKIGRNARFNEPKKEDNS